MLFFNDLKNVQCFDNNNDNTVRVLWAHLIRISDKNFPTRGKCAENRRPESTRINHIVCILLSAPRSNDNPLNYHSKRWARVANCRTRTTRVHYLLRNCAVRLLSDQSPIFCGWDYMCGLRAPIWCALRKHTNRTRWSVASRWDVRT